MRLHRCTPETGAPWHACDCYDVDMDVPQGAGSVVMREGNHEVIYRRETWRTREIQEHTSSPGPLLPEQAPFPGEPLPPIRVGEPSWGFRLWRRA